MPSTEDEFTERPGFKSRTKRNQNPSFLGASEKGGVCNQSEAPALRRFFVGRGFGSGTGSAWASGSTASGFAAAGLAASGFAATSRGGAFSGRPAGSRGAIAGRG